MPLPPLPRREQPDPRWPKVYPDAEIALLGVEEPLALIHAPNESVHPDEIANMGLAEALFLQQYAVTGR